MRKLLLSAFGFIALSGAGEASVADLPLKAAPLVPGAPVFNWSGLYFGASVGAQWFDSESAYAYPGGIDGPSSGSSTLGNTNAIIAFQFGRNWQAPGLPLVFGLEGDWTETNHDRSATLFTYPNGNHFDAESQLGIQGSVRGRIGVASGNWVLVRLPSIWHHVAFTSSTNGLVLPARNTSSCKCWDNTPEMW
jgi:hypothetical protein